MENQVVQQGKNQSTVAHELELLYMMLLIRRFEERAAEEYSKTNIRGFLHLYIGEEAAACGVLAALEPDDIVLSTYREHGHALARGIDPKKIMAEMFGKQEGCSGGRGGSMHLFDVSKNFYGGNAIVAGHLPIATGLGLALKKQNKPSVVCCFFGDGAVAEGEFHEAMNLSSLLSVPVLWVCENNQYAMGTALRYSHAMTDLEKKGAGYNIASETVDGMDVLAVESAAKRAVEVIHRTGKPYFLVCNTYRFRAHSMFDAELYRDKNEVAEWKERDPIRLFSEHLLAVKRISQNEIDELKNKAERETEEAVTYAQAGTWEPIGQLSRFTYSEKNV